MICPDFIGWTMRDAQLRIHWHNGIINLQHGSRRQSVFYRYSTGELNSRAFYFVDIIEYSRAIPIIRTHICIHLYDFVNNLEAEFSGFLS
jgi:hypothetical protein